MSRRGHIDQLLTFDQADRSSFHLQRLHGLDENALENIFHAQGGVHCRGALGQGSHDTCLALALGVQARIQHGNSGLVGDRLHQIELFIGEDIGLRVNEGQHTHQLLACQQGNTDGRLHAGFVHRIVGTHQPALVLAGIRNQDPLAVADYPSGQAAFRRITQLLGGMLQDLVAVDDGGIDGLACVIQHHDAAALPSDVLDCLIQDALQDSPQVERGRHLAADME